MADRNDARTDGDGLVGVQGWLLLFCIWLVAIAPLATLYQLHNGGAIFAKLPQSIAATLIFAEIALVTWGIFVALAIWQRRPNAHKEAEVYLVVLTGLKMLIAGPFCVLSGLWPHFLPVTLMALGWYAYLMNSQRVHDTFGPIEG